LSYAGGKTLNQIRN